MMAVAVLGVTALVLVQGYVSRAALRQSQLAGCARGKLDRADNAAGWTAHRKYISHVTSAASVKEDVKVAAREAIVTYERISLDLSRRARLDCAAAFPAPRLLGK
jgi:hypothetical protein